MSLRGSNTNVGTSNSEVVAAPTTPRALNIRSVTFTNTDLVPHTIILKDATTERFRYLVPPGSSSVKFDADTYGLTGWRLAAAAALNAATASAPGSASTVRVEAEYGRV